MPTCLIIQHARVERAYLVGEALVARGVDLDVLEVFDGRPVPRDASGADGVVVMGGPASAVSDDGFPSRREELALLADAVRRRVPTLGVCLGAQLLAIAVGGTVSAGKAGPEIGWGTVDLSPEAAGDPLFAGMPSPLAVLHWHRDTFSLPPGGVRLASNARYPNQAFRLGTRAWGLQFHLEVDLGAVRDFVGAFGDEAAAAGSDPDGIERAAPAALAGDGVDPGPAERGRQVGARFANLVAGGAAAPPIPGGGSL